ncbi:MAG: energy-coupled thiamine transporter ThiT [Clostridia bacterium]|nr:energy-coupled thiamine transporter ThiT [Clostridia bacterium]
MIYALSVVYPYDVAEPVLLWLTVAILAALVVSGIAVWGCVLAKKLEKDKAAKFAKYAFAAFIAYALIAGIIMLVLQLLKRMSGDYLEYNSVNHDVINFVFVPLLVLFAAVLVSGIALFIVGIKKNAAFSLLAKILGGICGAGVIAAGVTIGIYYSRRISDDGYYNGYGNVNELALYISAAALVIGAVVAAIILGRKNKYKFDSRAIALAGICIALSFVLSYVQLWKMPQGGSVTLVSLLPVMLYSYVYGTRKGILVGLIYGLMQAMQDPYIIHPAQFLLDYPIAFCFVAFAGAFSKIEALRFPQVKFLLGAILVSALRFCAHLLSGVFAFSAYATDAGFSGLGGFFVYSAAYNSFVFADMALVIAAGVAVLSSKAFVRLLEKYPKPVQPAEPITQDK